MEKKIILNEGIFDAYFLYTFLRKMTTPFKEMEAYKLGIIDDEGNVLKKSHQRTTAQEKAAFNALDLLVVNLKKILEKIPFGKSKVANFAAGLYLIKEGKIYPEDEDYLYEDFMDFYEEVSTMKKFKELYEEESDKAISYKGKVTTDEAKAIGDSLGVNFNDIDLEQFRMGIEIEQEHLGSVAHTLHDAAKIALDHLGELSDYYSRLKTIEESVVTKDQAKAAAQEFLKKNKDPNIKIITMTVPGTPYKFVHALNTVTKQNVEIAYYLDEDAAANSVGAGGIAGIRPGEVVVRDPQQIIRRRKRLKDF